MRSLICSECSRSDEGDAADWQAHLGEDGEGGETEVFLFCPSCAKREFAPRGNDARADAAP